MGSGRFLLAALAAHVVGVFLTVGFTGLTSALVGDWTAALVSESFVGVTGLVCGAAAAGSAALGTLWRRRLRVGLFTVVVLLALFSGTFQDMLNLFAAVVGAIIGPWLKGRRIHRPRFAVSRREARVLIALLVAACAAGPVIAALNTQAAGPLAVLEYLFTEVQPTDPATVTAVCADSAQVEDCAAARLQLRAGAGAVFMAVLPSFLLVVLADGLRRGRRFAWWAALIIQTLATIRAAAEVFSLSAGSSGIVGLPLVEAAYAGRLVSVAVALIVPLVVIVVLLMSRSLFTVSAPPGTYRRLVVVLAVAGIMLSALYVVIGLLLSDGFTPEPGFRQLLFDAPDRLLPLSQFLEQVPAIVPQSPAAVLLYEGVGVVFWLLAAVLMILSFLRPAHYGAGTDEDRARELLHLHGGSTLGWMTTWPGNSYWFSSSGSSYVAFRVLSGVALTLGEPVGPREELAATIDEFSEFCSMNGWAPCLYSVGGRVSDLTDATGWNSVQVAEETILPLGSIAFTGKKFQDIRTALNKAGKEGIRAEWVRYPSAPRAVVDQINAISEEWVADKSMPEMGFTLGSLDQVDDPEVRCLIAVDADRTVHAVTSWLPVYEDGQVVGWTLDFMRRRGTGFRASIEFLIASAALTLEQEGFGFISLSGAPLARLDPTDSPDAVKVLDRVLAGLGALLEPVYGFRSLLAFKAKFQPTYEALHMVYPDASALPAIANAVGRAYLPEVSLGQGLNLARKVLVRSA
ncbi:bifunctional lysylphosphatidylglycerol flippase/synthetase MprF [Arthrobacter echini]|nr:DUF2156 domain-containing protein [Arthrobacter echini]